MSITSGVGLFSGIDSASLIEQLLAIESRPKILAQQRIIELQTQQAAFLSINSALSALEGAANSFVTSRVFDSNSASSSDSGVLSATAGKTAATGSYTFLIDRLVTTQQQLSRGFSDRDNAGLGADAFTFEVGGGEAFSETRLSELNGGLGVTRGKIRITDRSGASATVDLSRALTVDDVLESINGAGAIQVEARVEGDRFVLEDLSGGSSDLIVENAFGSSTATGLGIAGSVSGTTLTGGDVRFVSGTTALALLNDGLGVEIADGSTDLKITARDGTVLNVDLGRKTETQTIDDEEVTVTTQTRATTVQDVIDIINTAASDAGLALTAGINGAGTGLVINDSTGGSGNLKIESAGTRKTAQNLGIAADVAASSVVGSRLLSGINSVLVSSLNGGSGVTGTTIDITDRAANNVSVNLSASALTGSLSDIVNEINAAAEGAGVNVRATLNRAGNGLALVDSSGASGNLVVGGDAAASLGIETAGVASSAFDGGNLQTKWIGRQTLLADLNVGQGIGTGEIRITDASGGTTTATIGDSLKTVGDLISFLNSRPGVDVNVAINDTGDGIVIRDESGGSGTLKIEDVSGTVAKSLNIRGEFEDEGSGIAADGSYERRVEFDAADTLEDVIEKINSAAVGVSATIINDGSGATPYRISLTSQYSGRAGRAIIDTGDLNLGLTSLSRGEDAVAFFGSSDPAQGVALTSSTNTLDDVIKGVTIDLKGASEDPVEVVVTRDTAAIESAVEEFVEAFNSAIDTIDGFTFYDTENNRRGTLLGDSTASNLRRSLVTAVSGSPDGVEGAYQFLYQAGVRIGSGSKLEFDRERFRSALEDDFTNVKELFSAAVRAPSEPIQVAPGATVANTEISYSKLGVAAQVRELVKSYVNSVDGVLKLRDQTLDRRIELQEDRVDRVDDQLARKRTLLERQFIAMEQALASLSTQQAALSSLQQLG